MVHERPDIALAVMRMLPERLPATATTNPSKVVPERAHQQTLASRHRYSPAACSSSRVLPAASETAVAEP